MTVTFSLIQFPFRKQPRWEKRNYWNFIQLHSPISGSRPSALIEGRDEVITPRKKPKESKLKACNNWRISAFRCIWNKVCTSSFTSLPLSRRSPKGVRMNFKSPLPLTINEYFLYKFKSVPESLLIPQTPTFKKQPCKVTQPGCSPCSWEQARYKALLTKGTFHRQQTCTLGLRRWLECIFSLHKDISSEASAIHANERFPKGHWQYKM